MQEEIVVTPQVIKDAADLCVSNILVIAEARHWSDELLLGVISLVWPSRKRRYVNGASFYAITLLYDHQALLIS